MGGHAEGARAAETALATLLEAFWQTPHPIFDPLGFLHLSLGRAHEEVVKLGAASRVEARPRATCAVCLVQDRRPTGRTSATAACISCARRGARAHARSQPRRGAVARGTDHRGRGSRASDAQLRRMLSRRRCGAAEMSISTRRKLKSRRCAAAVHRRLWANLRDQDFVRFAQTPGQAVARFLTDLGTQAVRPPRPTATTPVRRRCAGGPHERATERPRARRAAAN
jgi:hypothetical protein